MAVGKKVRRSSGAAVQATGEAGENTSVSENADRYGCLRKPLVGL